MRRRPAKVILDLFSELNINTHAKAQNAKEGLTLPMDLYGELASGCHDHGDWTLHLLQGSLIFDMPEHGKQESNGFARTSFGYTNDIPTRHDCWDGLSLNVCRRKVIELLDDFQTVNAIDTVF